MSMRIYLTPPPTPNTGLHLGHILGPYSRAALQKKIDDTKYGGRSAYITHIDTYQTYVNRMAILLRKTPIQLAQINTCIIKQDFKLCGIEVTHWSDNTRKNYKDFFQSCLSEIVNKIQPVPRKGLKTSITNLPAVEAYIQGTCQNCFSISKASVCEECLLPRHLNDLHDAKSSLFDEEFVADTREGLQYLPIKEKTVNRIWTEINKMCDIIPQTVSYLYKNLESHDLLFSYPDMYGLHISSNIMINPWIDIPIVHLFGIASAISEKEPLTFLDAIDTVKNARNISVNYFFGKDNTYYYAFMMPYLFLLLDLKELLPSNLTVSGFLTINQEKMSSSRGNEILVSDFFKSDDNYASFIEVVSNISQFQELDFSYEALFL